jgi:PAS domain S-box-containing protein
VTPMQSRPRASGAGAASADQFRLLVDAVKDYAIFLLDPEGRVVSWNAGAERIKGYTAEEILGQHFSRFYEPDDVAAGLPAQMLARAAQEGRVQGRGWRVRKDGGRFYAQVTLTALVDDQGRLSGYAKITQDVTAELEAERVRREREAQLAEAQAVAQLGSFDWALASDQVTWSPELYRILGLDPDSYCGTLDGLLALLHPDDRAEAEATLRRAATEGTSFRIQARILRPSGEERVLSSWGNVTRDEQGRPSRMLGVCQDVTGSRAACCPACPCPTRRWRCEPATGPGTSGPSSGPTSSTPSSSPTGRSPCSSGTWPGTARPRRRSGWPCGRPGGPWS